MTKKLAISIAFSAAFTISSFAGNPVTAVVWGTPTNISGDSDVSTLGTLVGAFNMAGPAVSLNGVPFTAFAVTPGSGNTTAVNGNFGFTETPGFLLTPNLGSAQMPFSTLSANYQSLLSSGISTSDNNTLTLTMSGLVAGQQYLFQWWLNFSGGTFPGYATTATALLSISLDPNTTDAPGGLGQFAIGTFTATSSVQSIAFNGINIDNAPTINAFQLRAVPEPANLALLGAGGVVLAAFVRKRRRG